MRKSDIIAHATEFSARFARILSFVLDWECEYDRYGSIRAENDPDDPGGLTFAGIDKRSHPDFPFHSPTPGAVSDIYYRYWQPFASLAFPVGEVVFNFAVNMGQRRAVELLQTAINILPGRGDTVVDGLIGPKTLKAARLENPHNLADLIEDRADLRYRGIVVARPRMRKFLRGWLNRDNALERWWMEMA
jgi:lysozyme family protein